MRVFVSALFVCLGLPLSGLAQSLPPVLDPRHIALTDGVDFPGGDLEPLFETDFDTCRAACLADAACTAFTFNTRSRACFPKTAVQTVLPFEGALSARVFNTDPATLAAEPNRAALLSFLRPEDAAAARDLARNLPQMHLTNESSAAALLDAARDARQSGAPLSALRLTGAALNLTDAAGDWLAYAELALGYQTETGGEQPIWSERAISAAINAFLRAAGSQEQAAALVVMALGLEQVGRGRDMIPVLRLAAALDPSPQTDDALAAATARYGFRITEHRVDNDSAAPRICAVFSEPLVAAGVDYMPFVQSPTNGLAVAVEDRQLCIEGVEHGAHYRLSFRAGLPAANGEVLSRTVPLEIYVRDRAPSVRFAGRGYVLPAGAGAAVPLVSVNADEVDLRLSKVSDRAILTSMQDALFGRPIPLWDEDRFAQTRATEVWRGTGQLDSVLNRDVTTRLPLQQAAGNLAPGLYVLQAAVQGRTEDGPAATQWFLVSDLGISSYQGEDGLHLYVRGLGDTGAKPDVTVQLLSRTNAVLAETRTDAEGYAWFAPGLLNGTAGAAPALVTLTDGARDFAFLSLTDPQFDLSDRGVAGRAPAPQINVFASTDRGAYRAGEQIVLTLLARDRHARAIADLPLTVILRRPDGVEYSRTLVNPAGAGGYGATLPLGQSVPRGTWTIAVHVDPDAAPLLRREVLVEDFLPERLDMVLDLPKGPLTHGQPVELGAQVDYLFGAPAPDLALSGDVMLIAGRTLDGFPGVRFGLHDLQGTARGNSLPGMFTDASGAASLRFGLPDLPATDRPVEARFTLTVQEGSGRPVERSLTRPVQPTGPLLGLRPLFDGAAPENGTAAFEIVGLTADLQPLDIQVDWVLNRVERDYQWFQLYGDWQWEPVTRRSRVATGQVRLDGGRAQIEAAVDWGQYEIEIARSDGAYLAASDVFSAGWLSDGDAASTPDLLEVGLDRAAYAVGDTAKLRVMTPEGGTGLLTVLGEGVIDRKVVQIAAGETSLSLPVTPAWGSGAYVTLSLLRPMQAEAGLAPRRALGLAHAAVDPGSQALSARFVVDSPRPAAGNLDAVLQVDGLDGVSDVWVTVAAVDVGILNLTGFNSPDPQSHYFGQRALGVGLRDLYGQLIDGLNGAMGTVRSGGDAGAAMRLQAPPPQGPLAVRTLGPVRLDAEGRLPVRFDFDGFNGTVRLMAVVWSDEGVGQAEANVILRDPIVAQATLPRFLAPGDSSILQLSLTHLDGEAGRVPLRLSSSGPVQLDTARLPSALELSAGGRTTVDIPIRAVAEGNATLTVALTTPDGTDVHQSYQLGVRANDPQTMRSDRIALAPGEVFTLDANALAEFRPGTGQVVLSAGPLAQFDAPGLLAALDRYPWGCTEQIASRALPLLYAQPLARAMGLDADGTLATQLEIMVQTLLTRQGSNGSFGLWGPGSGDLWLDAYVTDVLSRARSEGVSVPDQAFDLAIGNLRNRINYAADFDRGGEDIAYALHVMAREGSATIGDLRYYADVKGADFGTPMAQAQLASALAFYGDQPRADRLFTAAAARVLSAGPEAASWRADYGTNRRDVAALLALAVEAGNTVIDRNALVSAALIGSDQRPSTQEAAWLLLAAEALLEAPEAGLVVDGQSAQGPFVRVLDAQIATPLRIETRGARSETLTVTRFGVPEVSPPAGGRGYTIARAYFTMDGAQVQPNKVRVGTRMVTVLTVTPLGAREGRLMVVDPLPAGFEIDNPHLLTTGEVGALDWLSVDTEPQNVEFLTDQFRAAIDQFGTAPIQLAYIVRAVSPGQFHHPAAHVEDMYRPEFRAQGETSQIEVIR